MPDRLASFNMNEPGAIKKAVHPANRSTVVYNATQRQLTHAARATVIRLRGRFVPDQLDVFVRPEVNPALGSQFPHRRVDEEDVCINNRMGINPQHSLEEQVLRFGKDRAKRFSSSMV